MQVGEPFPKNRTQKEEEKSNEYRDETPIGKLMHDFSCTDPANMYYNELAERVRFFKEDKEGISILCKAMEDMRNESLQEGKKDESRSSFRWSKEIADGTSCIVGYFDKKPGILRELLI